MRRAGTGAPISNGSSATPAVAAPRSNGGSSTTGSTSSQRGKHRNLRSSSSRLSTVNAGSSSNYSILFFFFALILILADLLYLYRLSLQAMMNDPNHTSNFRATYLSRLTGGNHVIGNTTTTAARSGNVRRSHEGEVHVQKLPSPPPLPDDHEALEEDHHQHQMEVQQERNPPKPSSNMLHQQALEQGYHNLNDKGTILDILQQAGLQIQDLDQSTIDELPTWPQIQRLYGNEPRIVGLETCAAFRESVDARTRFFGVAGTFNSGTNLGKTERTFFTLRTRIRHNDAIALLFPIQFEHRLSSVAELMAKNCQITERMEVFGAESKGVRWQVRMDETMKESRL
jgi:hypothetical protein